MLRTFKRFFRWLNAPDPTPAIFGYSRHTARTDAHPPIPIPIFDASTRERIQAIFDRAARRKLREQSEAAQPSPSPVKKKLPRR